MKQSHFGVLQSARSQKNFLESEFAMKPSHNTDQKFTQSKPIYGSYAFVGYKYAWFCIGLAASILNEIFLVAATQNRNIVVLDQDWKVVNYVGPSVPIPPIMKCKFIQNVNNKYRVSKRTG